MGFIRSLPLGVFLVMLLFPLAMAAIAVFAGLHARRRAAIIQATPTSSIAMATDGYREFEGKVEAIGGATIQAPLTLAPCCWYHAKVEKWDRVTTGDRKSDWRTVREATSDTPFFVRDASGACVVLPVLAEVTPTDRSLWYGAAEVPTDRNPKRVGPAESAKGMIEVSGGPNSKYRFSEERIYAGDPLLVLGDFSTGRFGTASSFATDDEDDLDIADDESDEDGGDDDEGKDGVSADDLVWGDPERDDALLEKAREVTRATIEYGSGKQPFILTTTPQDKHVEMTGLGAKGAIGVAIVPLALAAFLLWARFG
jgi:hypothetical protein